MLRGNERIVYKYNCKGGYGYGEILVDKRQKTNSIIRNKNQTGYTRKLVNVRK